MKNKAEFYAKIRFNVDFISDEHKKINTHEPIGGMIEMICKDISD